MFNFFVEGILSFNEIYIYWRFEDLYGFCIVLEDGKNCFIKINFFYIGYLLLCILKCCIFLYDEV